jgi:hypothetical protein
LTKWQSKPASLARSDVDDGGVGKEAPPTFERAVSVVRHRGLKPLVFQRVRRAPGVQEPGIGGYPSSKPK